MFCSFLSLSAAALSLASMALLSKSIASACFCSVSVSASPTHGVSLVSTSFSSMFFSRLAASVPSPALSSFQSLNVFTASGFFCAMWRAMVLAYSDVARSTALLVCGCAIVGRACTISHAGLLVCSIVSLDVSSFTANIFCRSTLTEPGLFCVNVLVTVTLSLSGSTAM